MNIYIELTKQFNKEKLRTVICSGQAVVLHRLAIMSKDGDWILREDTESMNHVLKVLSERKARYRFGAPLDVRWMVGGWSSHFQFSYNRLRIRTDFFTRPPRISTSRLDDLWKEQEGRDLPFMGVKDLAELKKTNREKDYVVIGELARLMTNIQNQFLYSRSAGDLINLAKTYPDIFYDLVKERPNVLNMIPRGREKLETALDAERRKLIHANEKRLKVYMEAASAWSSIWPDVAKEIADCPLMEAHAIIVKRAEKVLPFTLS
ncbi:hypothetical protein ES703_106728 [subsurface metagenome]